MMAILTLAVMVVLVATMRRPGGRIPHGGKSAGGASMGGMPRSQPRFKPAPGDHDDGVVSYRLMSDKKLPSPALRALRRVSRPFGWFQRRFSRTELRQAPGEGRVTGDSVELQNFLDARNREIARRKSEGASKRGPDDTLH